MAYCTPGTCNCNCHSETNCRDGSHCNGHGRGCHIGCTFPRSL